MTPPTWEDLPTWDDMTDLDKGAALMHLHKRDWEGGEYAERHYPARFYDHPALVALDTVAASKFAATLDEDAETLLVGEHERLYDLALNKEREDGQW